MTVSIEELHVFLKRVYQDAQWSLSRADLNTHKEHLSTLTYGEIKESSVEEILSWLQLSSEDVVYDLGCGLGRFVAQVYLRSEAKAVFGIELTESRYRQARRMLDELRKIPHVHAARQIDIHQGDISEVTCADATVVYMCSTCFPNQLLNAIVDNLQLHAAVGLRLMTLKRLPVPGCFHLLSQRDMEMTWSDNSPVYLYQLELEPPEPEHRVLPDTESSLLASEEDDWDSIDLDIDSFDWDSDDA